MKKILKKIFWAGVIIALPFIGLLTLLFIPFVIFWLLGKLLDVSGAYHGLTGGGGER